MKIILIFILLTANHLSAQSSKIDSLVSIIENANVVSAYTKGINGIISNEYQAYQSLINICEIDQLVALCKHQNACVRCYSFLTVYHKNKALAEEILSNHVNDNETITVINGCFGQIMSVSNFMKTKGGRIENMYGFRF